MNLLTSLSDCPKVGDYPVYTERGFRVGLERVTGRRLYRDGAIGSIIRVSFFLDFGRSAFGVGFVFNILRSVASKDSLLTFTGLLVPKVASSFVLGCLWIGGHKLVV